jgi:glutamine synthetase
MNAADVVREVDEAGLRLVRFLYCGNDGTMRGKSSSRHGLEGRIQSGIGLTVAMQAMNGLDQLQSVPNMGPVGEVRLRPDPGTFRVLPYAPRTGAMMVDKIGLDGNPDPVCQRSFLARMCDRLSERGVRLEVAFENEFSLARAVEGGYEPVDSSLCFATIGMTTSQDVIDDLVGALEAQQIVLEQYYAELGHGQHEISTGHAPALTAVDEQLYVRETIRAVATAHGLTASLAPKPWPQNAGNGCHIHFSLWEGDRNRFHDPAGPGNLSAEARAFVAGVLEHLPGMCGLAAPSFNSYHRIIPQYWAGAFTCWGIDNREAPLRVPSLFAGMEEASTNVELKSADATCNPYLAVGGLIAAGLDGIERGLDLPAPVQVDPATLSQAEREAKGIRPLPASQREALDALAADDVLTGAMGEVLARSYLAVRGSEWEAYSAADAEFEQQGHFEKY